MAFGSAVVAQPGWVSLDGSQDVSKPAATVINSDESETVIRFRISGFLSEDIDVGGMTFQTLRLPGHFTTMEIGKAQLPEISEFVAIPDGARVRVTVVDYNEETLSGFRVYPFQKLLYEAEDQPPFEIDERFYQRNTFLPEITGRADEPSVWRHIRVTNLTVSPFRYNPATAQLKVCTDITVKLEYTGTESNNGKALAGRAVTSAYDKMYRRSVLNYDWLSLTVEEDGSKQPITHEGYDYLIISADRYIGNLAAFVAWKNSLGISTKVVPVSQIGADTLAIKEFVLGEYSTDNIQYLLFVGNEDDIPGYEGYTVIDHGDTIFSDYYYSLLDGKDDLAEIAVGRFSVEDAVQLDNMVQKSIVYEYNPSKGDWLESVLLVANAQEAPLKYQECKEQIRTAEFLPGHIYEVLTPNFITAYGAAESRGGNRASNADVIAAINNGQRVVNYRGHGATDYWSYWNVWTECFTNADVDQLHNGDRTPVVFSIACWNNNLRSETPCLGEAFTCGDDAAVAFLSATVPSRTDINHEYDKNIFALIFNDGVNAIGDVTNEATIHLIRQYHDYAVQNARSYLWLGDPSLNVIFYGDPGPDEPALAHPDDGINLEAPAQPMLDWNEVAAATSYEVVIADTHDFTSPVAGQGDLTVTEWMAPSLETGTYYWRVRAFSNDIKGAWSEVRTLNVGVAAPTLYSPGDGAVMTNGDSLALDWLEVPAVTSFTVQIDDDALFGSPVIDDLSSECLDGHYFYYISPRLAAGTWYWRVKGNAFGLPWSQVWQFTIPATAGEVAMHVADMDVVSWLDLQYRFTGECSLLVVDQNENPVPGADVECYWDKFEAYGTTHGITNDRGIAVLYTRTLSVIYAPFCFEVTDIRNGPALYDAAANLVTKACEYGWVYKNADYEANTMPAEFRLDQNYPNPFNPKTDIRFSLPQPANVRLEIFNIIGQKVATLVDRHMSAGSHSVTWDGSSVASGIYLYRLQAGDVVVSKKMMLVK